MSSSLVRRSHLVSCRRLVSRLVLRCVRRGGLAFFCSMSSGVFCCLISSCVVGVSWRVACGEIELTKNGASCRLPFRLTRLVLVLRGDGNRARSNGGETRDRCRSIPAARSVVYARRSFPLINPLVRSSPDLGAGELIETGGQGRAGRRGSGENEKKRACFHRSFPSALSVCLCLAPVVACGILYRLIPSVSSFVSSYPSRSIVSYCCVSSVLLFARLVPSLTPSVHCRRSCLAPIAPAVVFASSFSVSVIVSHPPSPVCVAYRFLPLMSV